MFSRKDRPSWKELIREVVGEVRLLISQELALAKAEFSETMAKAGKGAGLLVAGLAIVVIGMIPFVIFLGLGLAALVRMLGVSPLNAAWIGFAAVALCFFLVGLILLAVGGSRLKGFSPKPNRALSALREPLDYPSSNSSRHNQGVRQ